MKYIKLILAGSLVVISLCQYFICGFLEFMVCWLIYSLLYLAVCVYQKIHGSFLPSQIFTLLYVFVPLVAIIAYAVKEEFSQLTQAFYTVFTIALACAFVWELVTLFFVIKERSDEKKHRS